MAVSMIGDLILYIKTWVQQNLLCIHDYKEATRDLMGRSYTTKTCRKCGRTIVE